MKYRPRQKKLLLETLDSGNFEQFQQRNCPDYIDIDHELRRELHSELKDTGASFEAVVLSIKSLRGLFNNHRVNNATPKSVCKAPCSETSPNYTNVQEHQLFFLDNRSMCQTKRKFPLSVSTSPHSLFSNTTVTHSLPKSIPRFVFI